MSKNATYVIRGTLHWAKVFGAPRLNEFTGEKEWSVDVTPNEAGMKKTKEIGITDKLRDPKVGDKRTERFLSFRQKEFRGGQDGTERVKNNPIRVVDAEGNEWPENKLIGNGTTADIKFVVRDNGKGRPKGAYIQAIRVLKLVPYEVQDFAPLDEDDEFYGDEPVTGDAVDTKGDSDNPDDLDDDIPF